MCKKRNDIHGFIPDVNMFRIMFLQNFWILFKIILLNFVYFINLPFGVCKNASLMLSLALVVSGTVKKLEIACYLYLLDVLKVITGVNIHPLL